MKPVRAVGLVIHKESILLMRRKKNGKHFYVFPGGHVDEGESIEAAVVRELFEETTLEAVVERCVYDMWSESDVHGPQEQYVYLCTYISGVPTLGACEERERMEESNQEYEPLWACVDDIDTMNIYPTELKTAVIDGLANGFNSSPVKLLLV